MPGILGRRLLRSLEGVRPAKLRRCRAVWMPDLFVDHFVSVPPWVKVAKELGRVHNRGGGFMVAGPQRIHHGGNAANAALALARLGVRTSLVAQTDATGASVLAPFAARAGLDIRRVRTDGKLAVTLALEFAGTGANVLVAEPGSVESYGPASLERLDWKLVDECDVVAVVNWTKNRRGTELARRVFGRAKAAGARTFFDTADPTERRSELGALKARVLRAGLVDVWGLNENELDRFAGPGAANPRPRLRALQGLTRGRIDLHTARWAASAGSGGFVRVPSVPVGRRRRSTGAGDAWNAGDVLGDLLELPDDERLLLAHAVAGYYVSSAEPEHPTLAQLIRFLRSRLG